MDRPEQREVVLAVVGSYRLASLRQCLDSTLFGKQIPNLFTRFGICFTVFGGLQNPTENGDQTLFSFTISLLKSFELLLCCGLSLPDPPKEHLDQFVATARSGLLDETEKQGVAFAWAADIQEITHFHGGSFGCKLSELGVGNAFQHRIRVDQAGQPIQALCPLPDRVRARGTRCLFKAIEGCGHRPRLNNQQSIQSSRIACRQPGGDLFIHLRMDLSTQMVGQAFKRAKSWQIDSGFAQRLNCRVDQVGRITHRCCCVNDGCCHQLFARLRISRSFQICTRRRTIMMESRLSTGLLQNCCGSIKPKLRGQMCKCVGVDISRR